MGLVFFSTFAIGIISAGIAALPFCFGAAEHKSSPSVLQKVRLATAPRGAKISPTTEVEGSQNSRAWTWTVEAPGTWKGYIRQLAKSMDGIDFMLMKGGAPVEYFFHRSGDVYYLQAKALERDPLKVGITFKAMPD